MRTLLPLVITLAVLSACSTTAPSREDAHASLVAAERAFAMDAREHGVRDAFLRHFAPGGVMFVPGPSSVNEVFATPPPDPLAVLLEWEPVASGVAASGDFGFTTGPARISRRDGSAPPRFSTFFSVWKRPRDGPWRVVIDAGVRLPGAVPHERMQPAPKVAPAAPHAEASVDALLAGERGTWSRAAFLALLAPDAQAQRPDAVPVQGAAGIAAAWPDDAETLAPIGGDMAASGDLAYTYGRASTARGSGHYLHLWTRSADGRGWRIGAALRLP
ncbi:MAG TPA: hypothetical protein VFX05_14715 [Casimicrobiaceae bacterium]|nr:hypothetical protein [Casimicrobiaceae bacterium]